MKQFRLLLLASMIMSMLSFQSKAADYSFSVSWDTPGAVRIVKGTPAGAPMEMADDATSWTGTESGDSYYFKPAEGYILESVTEKAFKDDIETTSSMKLNGNDRYGQFCGKFFGSALNGASYTIKTKKLQPAGKFTLDVKNGADKFDVWFKNAKSGGEGEFLSTFRKPAVEKGAHEMDLQENENFLNIYPNGNTGIYEVTLNGDKQTKSYGGFEVPVKNGDNVVVRVYEQDPARYEVTVKFTDNKNCLENIYNRASGKFIDLSQAEGSKFSGDEGDVIQFMYKEDVKVTEIKLNGAPAETSSDKGYSLTLKGDTEIEFTSEERVYAQIPVTLYIANGEGVNIRKGAFEEDEAYDLGEGEELAEDVTFANSGKVIKKGEAKKYVINVSEKRPQFFWSPKPGYWITDALTSAATEAGEFASPGVMAEDAPFYLAAKKINNDKTLVLFFDGAEKEGKLIAKNPKDPGNIAFPGMPECYMPVGYTVSSFDAEYHSTVTAGKVGLPYDKAFDIFVNGVKQLPGDDGSFAFKISEDPTVIKVFSLDTDSEGEIVKPTSAIPVNFTVEDGCSAEVTYDKVLKHQDLTTPLETVGKSLVSIRPAAGTFVIVDDKTIEPDQDGNCEFWTEKRRYSVLLSKTASVAGIAADDNADARIFNLQGIEMKGEFDALPAGVYVRGGKKVIKK